MQKMSAQAKFWLLILLPLACMLVVAFLNPLIGDGVALALIPIGIFCGIGLMGLSCPHCHASLLYREAKVFGLTTRAFWPSMPKTCPHCGKPTATC
jgi:hypothetical protein